MSVLGKLKFWRKEELPEFPAPPDASLPEQPFEHIDRPLEQMGLPRSGPGITEPQPEPSFGQQFGQPAFAQQPQAFQQPVDQQLQLISSKLDTIKAQLETVLQRLDRLERGEERPYQQRWRGI